MRPVFWRPARRFQPLHLTYRKEQAVEVLEDVLPLAYPARRPGSDYEHLAATVVRVSGDQQARNGSRPEEFRGYIYIFDNEYRAGCRCC